jgi:hypothetical protein
MVAKSYQKLSQVGEPYMLNGKMYVKVQKGDKVQQVRWYNETEYAKMYPGETTGEPQFGNQKDMLGFQEGYITIFRGDQEKWEHWFERSIARYNVHWGWYIVSANPVPFDLPAGLEPVKLLWNVVGNGKSLKDEASVRTAVQSLLLGSHPSTFQGKIDERVELTITVIKSGQTENYFGKKAHHVFVDEHGNHYVWDTGAKFWAEGSMKRIRATIKEHKVINNIQTTVLTRCMEQ